jgi:hypothetical protein
VIRRARAADQADITALVRRARINLRSLHWSRFVVADDDGWGFYTTSPRSTPGSMSRQYRIGRVVTSIGSLILRRRIRIVPLERGAGLVGNRPPSTS